jgi:hypothetical protein
MAAGLTNRVWTVHRYIMRVNVFPGVIYCSTVHYRNVEAIIQMILHVERTYEDTDLREWWV